MTDSGNAPPEVPKTVLEEQKILDRTLKSLKERVVETGRRNYDVELLALRDELAEARLEDAPPLIAQMERLQAVAARRQEVVAVVIDAKSPYFAHLRLKENGKTRDVCIGRGTYVDPDHAVRIVDWRNAPVSRIYYRYQEGESYEETFGDKDVEGEVLIRRDITISQGDLLRVGASDATYMRRRDGSWKSQPIRSTRLAGGMGTAVLPQQDFKRGSLGSGEGEDGIGRRDRFLPDIAALLDPQQFEAISRPAAGVVVIQGGAGSGKTTIGLHRIAYLAFQAPKRFTGDRVLVVVPSKALATYTSRVLPALDVPSVPVVTMTDWQRDNRRRAFPKLPTRTTDETPLSAMKLKKSPALLVELDRRIATLASGIERDLLAVCDKSPKDVGVPVRKAWKALEGSPLTGRLAGVRKWLLQALTINGVTPPTSSAKRVPIDVMLQRLQKRAKDLVTIWADLLTDKAAMLALVDVPQTPGLHPLVRSEVEEAHRWCSKRCEAILGLTSGDREPELTDREDGQETERDRRDAEIQQDEQAYEEGGPRVKRRGIDEDMRAAYRDDDDSGGDPYNEGRSKPIDGRDLDEGEDAGPMLDNEDDAILLYLYQKTRGPLRGKGKSFQLFDHVFVDEVQDQASIDLALLVACTLVVDGERSMTLTGDSAQRLTLDVGLGDFAPALRGLGLPHAEVEPLQIGYRSTRQVLELAREVLGPIAPPTPPIATRDGAPIERHVFQDQGAAASFLASALRDLAMRESLASVCIISRHPWQADLYFDVLSRAEIPNLRRIRDQDFPFTAGIDVTDVRQVKGLEWDYVVLIDVNQQSYPAEDEARHLLHIAATRAAHQLWLVSSGEPSPLLKWEEEG